MIYKYTQYNIFIQFILIYVYYNNQIRGYELEKEFLGQEDLQLTNDVKIGFMCEILKKKDVLKQ